MPRMNILNALEEEAHDAPPKFSSVERKAYFELPHDLAQIAEDSLRHSTNQVSFILACGYFRAAKRFFTKPPHPRDLEYVCAKLGLSIDEISLETYHRATAMRHRRLILSHYGFKDFDRGRGSIKTEIESMVRSQLKPRLIFYRAVDVLIEQKVALPSSDALSKLILDSLNNRRQELVALIDQTLSAETGALLDQLLAKAVDENDEPINRFRLTLLKRCSQSTRPGKIKESVDDLKLIRDLQEAVRPVLEKLELSHDGISYYANSVIRSDTFDVTRRSDQDRYLDLIAFITHQFFRLQDNLVDVFLTTVQSAINSAQRKHKERCYEQRSARGEAVEALIVQLERSLKFIHSVDHISEDSELDDTEKIVEIRSLLNQARDDGEEATTIKNQLQSELSDADYFDILEEKSLRMQNRATPVLKGIRFNAQSNCEALSKAIEHFKSKDGAIDELHGSTRTGAGLSPFARNLAHLQ